MARVASTSSKDSTPTDYHLPPPRPRRLVSPIAAVARGYRVQVQLGVRARIAAAGSSPTPTEPEASPVPLTGREGLRRTYSFLEPTNARAMGTAVPPTLGLDQHTPASTAVAQGGTPPVDFGAMVTNISPTGSPRTPVPAVVGQPQHDSSQDSSPGSTPITGIELGRWGLFRTINSVVSGLQTFGRPMAVDDFIHLRLQLDLSDGGLTPLQFRDMFGQCDGCKRFMLMRGKDHHRCPGMYALPQLAPPSRLFLLLDCTSGGGGLTRSQFHNLFASCVQCSLIFTRATAAHHFHIHDDEDL